MLADIMKETSMVKSAAYRYLMILKDRGLIEYNGKGTLQLAGNSNCYRKYGVVYFFFAWKMCVNIVNWERAQDLHVFLAFSERKCTFF